MNTNKYKKIKKIKKEIQEDIKQARYFRKIKPPNRKLKKRTGCEKEMIDILTHLNLEFEVEHPIYFAGQWKIYDFLVGGRMLIEVDGDYWHGNPNLVVTEEKSLKAKKYNMIQNKRNDIIKNFIAKRRGFTLLRFWESDIFEKKDEVIQAVLKGYHDLPPETTPAEEISP